VGPALSATLLDAFAHSLGSNNSGVDVLLLLSGYIGPDQNPLNPLMFLNPCGTPGGTNMTSPAVIGCSTPLLMELPARSSVDPRRLPSFKAPPATAVADPAITTQMSAEEACTSGALPGFKMRTFML
jgi:hypothetical protein